MGSIFETAMLVCFGFSWPMNVIKGLKAKTAKGMSLAFILLIITGYVAGITAKVMNHQINYVLIVYLLNLGIVLTNLGVYFRNRSIDRSKASMVTEKVETDAVVLVGGSLDKEIPVAEVAQSFGFNFKMYNRSKYGLSVKDAKKVFIEEVEILKPEAVILHIGSDDVEMFKSNSAEFDIKYLELISCIKNLNSNRRVALVGMENESSSKTFAEMNRHIKAIADSEKCDYISMENVKLWNPENTKEVTAFMYDLGFDSQLKVKKPLGDISKVLYSYAYKNGMFEASDIEQAV